MPAILIAILLLTGLSLGGCERRPPELVALQQDGGELVVVTRHTATTRYLDRNGASGFEQVLISRFAEAIGVPLRVVVVDDLSEMRRLVLTGRAHFAAAGLAVVPALERQFRFTRAVLQVQPQLAYRQGSFRPRSPNELEGARVGAVAGSINALRLRQAREHWPTLDWDLSEHADPEHVLARVANHELDHAVVSSHELSLARRLYPRLKPAFELGPPVALAWMFDRSPDASLFEEADNFIAELQASGELARLQERFFGYLDTLSYVDLRDFHRHFDTRLPKYRALFEQAADKLGLDWRLLAAIAYQESHWNPKAVSPTGVRGLMMLTRGTARQMGVKNRTDPAQSIDGGARYFVRVRKKLPERIVEPDRSWLALASYNIGFGHLEDARRLAQGSGGDPDNWLDVREALPLLTDPKWHARTRYGYARGHEAASYVANIRGYFELLRWLDKSDTPPPTEPTDTSQPSLPAAL